MASRSYKIFGVLVALLFLVPACGGHRVSSKKPNSSYSWKKKGAKVKKGRRYNGKLERNQFIWPASGPLSSPYGPRWGRMHDGIDIGGDSGDPIVAAARGEVVYSDRLGGYGNLVVIKHPTGFFTAYGHNKKNLVKKGAQVKQGQTIARMGRTGRATGDHLHFEVRDQDGTFDPIDILARSRAKEPLPRSIEFEDPEIPALKAPIEIAEKPPEPFDAVVEIKKHPDDPFVAPAAPSAPAPPADLEAEQEGMMELLSEL